MILIHAEPGKIETMIQKLRADQLLMSMKDWLDELLKLYVRKVKGNSPAMLDRNDLQLIEETTARFGNSLEAFSVDKPYRNTCAMCILQIGELDGHLSQEFRTEYWQMPWNEIRGMRNVVAHAYGSISVQTTWEAIEQDIPALKRFCEEILAVEASDSTR